MKIMNLFTLVQTIMRWFLRQSIRGGRCTAFNRYYKSKVVDKIFRTISEDLNVSANLHEVIEAYVKYMSKGKTRNRIWF